LLMRTLLALLLVLAAFPTQAALLGRLPVTPGGTDYRAYYDTTLEITWLGNANLAATETFGVSGIFPGGYIYWDTANSWVAAMNAANYLGFNQWRLPTVAPINGVAFANYFSNNATTDFGYADSSGWTDSAASPVSELGHMYYVNLQNRGICTPNDAQPGSCVQQPGWDIVNAGPLQNLQIALYWSSLKPPNPAVRTSFNFYQGIQVGSSFGDIGFAWAVRDGDVAVVPIPAAAWLLGSALGLLGWMRRRNSKAGE
jgi:hypothetical protein